MLCQGKKNFLQRGRGKIPKVVNLWPFCLKKDKLLKKIYFFAGITNFLTNLIRDKKEASPLHTLVSEVFCCLKKEKHSKQETQ
jgi:hypothetical protein